MPKLNVLNVNGQNVGEIELAEAVFGVEVNEHVLYEVVKNQLANKRQGTQSAKTRAEVRGGGRKPWKQKGTGRARQGSIRAPQWRGGGVVFGPTGEQNFAIKQNRKEARLTPCFSLLNTIYFLEILFNCLFNVKSSSFVKSYVLAGFPSSNNSFTLFSNFVRYSEMISGERVSM